MRTATYSAWLPLILLAVCCATCSDGRKLVNNNDIPSKPDEDNEIPSSDGCMANNRRYKVGEQWSTRGECMLFTCYEGGSYGAVTCPSVRFRENSGCKETEIDTTKLYPDCCPQITCPQDKTRTNKINNNKTNQTKKIKNLI